VAEESHSSGKTNIQAVIPAQLLDIDRSTGSWIFTRNTPRFVVEALEEERIALAMACHAVMSR
jgi:hypothetical protein